MAKHLYLLAYNTINTLLWLYILLTTLSLSTSTSASPSLYTTLESSTRWTQSLAIADILHAALGTSTATQFYRTCVLKTNRNNPRPRPNNLHSGLHPLRPSMGY